MRNLAVKEGLTEDLNYEPKLVRWIISLDQQGRFLGLISTADTPGKTEKPVPRMMQIPRRAIRRRDDNANFLVDNPEYVLGLLDDPHMSKSRLQRAIPRRLIFLAKIRKAANAMPHSILGAVGNFLESEPGRAEVISKLRKQGYASYDMLCFDVAGSLAHDSPEVRAYFSNERSVSRHGTVQCLICGETRLPTKKHPSVQLRGGSPTGNVVVSFNATAFESFGWHRNENAAVCQDCAESYITGLRRLVTSRYPDPYNPGKVLPPRYIGLTNDTTAVFWTDAPNESLNLFADVFEKPHPQAIKAILESPWSSSDTEQQSNQFHCILISGGRGRATIRGSQTSTLGQVETSVKQFFSANTQFWEKPPPLFAFFRALVAEGRIENLPTVVACDIFLAIIFGFKYPRAMLLANTQRCRAERNVTRERAIFLRVYFERNRRTQEFAMGVNRELIDTGYRLGRLLAVLERLQSAANRNTNKTVVNRYYGPASTRPSAIFPLLIRSAQYQVANVKNRNFFQKEIGDVLETLPSLPAHLSLEEQGLFALGYYHQRKEYLSKSETIPD